ncbi:MAG: 4Fe-4S dicluster domain-containing protein [Actinobacteria bacterium]|nr:4Fe-4S dicluster domain-containing protein [Actinomycetota bacterium]
MLYKVLDKSDYRDFIKALISKYEFIGPKKKDKSVHDFVPIKNISELDTNYMRTTIPPAKKILFPPNEQLVAYELGENINVRSVVESSKKILFGINAWDINGMNFLDKFFTTDFIDENYVAKREKLLVIGMDSEPTETNFSPSMGAEYAKDGFDIYLTELKDKYFIRIATARGNEIVEIYAKTRDASAEDFKEYDKYMEDYRMKFKVDVDIKSFYDNFELTYSNEDLWREIAKDCYSCGSCNLVCPTCFCFNVRDDIELNLKDGSKTREWDSCMIPEYGLVAGGHNFRPDKENRLKQRYRCKLKTFLDKFGKYACVGCGRCIEACLAKINIAEDINSVKKEVSI